MADPIRLRRIDASNIEDHARLGPDDQCLFLFEYTSGRNWAFSSTNSLIFNLKKKPSLCSGNERYYKDRAIGQAAAALRQALNLEALRAVTLVPVPGSKAADHADHDPRMERVCQRIAPDLDVRSLVVQTQSTTAAHEAGDGDRITVEELLAVYAIDEAQCDPAPHSIVIVDDVLTAGTHFRAMQLVVSQRFPGVPVFGLFIARRVFATAEEG